MSKKKCNRKKCKDIKKGLKDVKKGRITTYKSIDEWEHEYTIWKNMHPIRYKIQQVYYSIRRFPVKIVDFFLYDIKAFIQRGRRGFAQRDTWGFDSYLAKVISEGIDSLIKELHGHPCDLKNLKQWKSILKKISKTFKTTIKIDDNELDYIATNVKDKVKFRNKLKRINKKIKKKHGYKTKVMTEQESLAYEEGWELFQSYYFNLYD